MSRGRNKLAAGRGRLSTRCRRGWSGRPGRPRRATRSRRSCHDFSRAVIRVRVALRLWREQGLRLRPRLRRLPGGNDHPASGHFVRWRRVWLKPRSEGQHIPPGAVEEELIQFSLRRVVRRQERAQRCGVWFQQSAPKHVRLQLGPSSSCCRARNGTDAWQCASRRGSCSNRGDRTRLRLLLLPATGLGRPPRRRGNVARCSMGGGGSRCSSSGRSSRRLPRRWLERHRSSG